MSGWNHLPWWDKLLTGLGKPAGGFDTMLPWNCIFLPECHPHHDNHDSKRQTGALTIWSYLRRSWLLSKLSSLKDLPELYSMTSDPQENVNVASLPQHAEVVMMMMMLTPMMKRSHYRQYLMISWGKHVNPFGNRYWTNYPTNPVFLW